MGYQHCKFLNFAIMIAKLLYTSKDVSEVPPYKQKPNYESNKKCSYHLVNHRECSFWISVDEMSVNKQ
jgi:hypothetical protein